MKSRRTQSKPQHSFGATYRSLGSYLRESAPAIFFIFGLFVVAGLFGFFYADHLTFLNDVLRELIEKTRGLSALELIAFIFANNLQSSLSGLVFGVVLGIFPCITAVINGVVLGYVLAQAWAISGASDFWRIVPHGIFELPAVFISLGLGVRLGTAWFVPRGKWEEFIRRAKYSALVFFGVVVPLLIIAAVIEGLLIAFM